ncbi:MAG: protease complex subunit PrcB family protein [Bacillota bacterium]
MKKNFYIIFLILIGLLVTACNNQEKNDTNKSLEFDYEIASLENIEDEEIKDWYENNRKSYGVYKFNVSKNDKFLLLSAGRRKTGGYSLKIKNVNQSDKLVEFIIDLDKPSSDEMVTQVITYPTLLLKVNANQEFDLDAKLDFEEEKLDKESNKLKFKKVKGTYIGQIDNNFIEVNISENSDFKKNANYKNNFLSLKLSKQEKEIVNKLESGNNITFTCYKGENNTWVIENISID